MIKKIYHFIFAVIFLCFGVLGGQEGKTEFPELTGPYLGQQAPTKKAELFMSRIISTLDGPEMCAAFTKNGKEFYYNALYQGNWAIFQTREIKGRWIKPVPMTFTSGYTDRDFTISPDGNTIYFGSNRPRQKRGGKLNSLDIFKTRRIKGKRWSEPENLGAPINTDFGENYPCVAANGNLYFFSCRGDGWGGCDLYVSRYVKGKYQKPQNLGPAINSKQHDWDAYIAPDESYIIFSSKDRQDTVGGQDLYISYKNKNTQWTKAKNMGPRINSPYCEICPSVSLDGKYLFFTSRRRGKADIFWINARIIKELNPEISKK